MLGDRAEQDVDRGLVAVDQRTVEYLDVLVGAGPFNAHVLAAGGDRCKPRHHTVVVRGFFDADLTQVVQAFGEQGGELFRHVLDHDDAGRHRRQRRQDGFERLSATGGCADGDDLLSGFLRPTRGATTVGAVGTSACLGRAPRLPIRPRL